MLKIGLTGGIGSGKSTVADLFAELGASIIDTDRISHQLTDSPEIINELVSAFGTGILADNQQVDRRQLAAVVFADSAARDKLEAILHPKIRQQVALQFEQLQHQPYVIVVVPLLLETDFHRLVDRILVIDASVDEQIQRVHQRDGRDEAAIRAIMENQLERQERLYRADDVIDNSGSVEALSQQVARLHDHYCQASQY